MAAVAGEMIPVCDYFHHVSQIGEKWNRCRDWKGEGR